MKMNKGAHNSSTLLSCQCKQTLVFSHIFVLAHYQISIFAGIIHLFFTLHLELRLIAVIGYAMYRPSVNSQVTLNLPAGKMSTKIAVYTTLITPLTKYELVVTPIANVVEEWFHVMKKRFNDQRLDSNCDSDQYGGCGLDCTVLRICGGAYRIVSKKHGYNVVVVRILPQDLQEQMDVGLRVRDYCWDYGNGSINCFHWYVYFIEAYYTQALSLRMYSSFDVKHDACVSEISDRTKFSYVSPIIRSWV